MRIGLSGYFLERPQTGSGQYTQNLRRELRALGQDVVVLGPPGRGKARKVWFEQVSVPRLGRQLGLDVLHVPYLGSPLLRPTRTVVTVHDLIMLVLREHRGSRAFQVYTKLATAAARRADLILADSVCTQHDVVRLLGVPAERVRVVYLGVDAQFRPVADAERLAAARQRYGLPDGYILYMGGLDWRKNVATLLQAYAQLDGPPPLAIGGRAHSADRRLYPDLPSLARELGLAGKVLFLGWVAEEDKALLYAGALLFAFPSRYEGFGLTPLEAMACGTPVICSNAASLPEIVGDGALLCSPTDVGQWAAAMRELLGDGGLAARLGQRGLQRAAHFTWRRTAEQTLACYEETAKLRT